MLQIVIWVHKQKSKGPKERRSLGRKNNNSPSLARDNLSKVGSSHPMKEESQDRYDKNTYLSKREP